MRENRSCEIGTMQGIHCGYMEASKRKMGNFRPGKWHVCPKSKQDIKTVYYLQECYSSLLQDFVNNNGD